MNENKKAIKNESTEFYKSVYWKKNKKVWLGNDFTARQGKRLILKVNMKSECKDPSSVLCLPYSNDAHKRAVFKILDESDILNRILEWY